MAQARQQAAVIPYRIRKERIEIALVTTSGGRGWIVPKGSVDDGERPRDAAIREAEEEAGLRGVVTRKPLGRYRHDKSHDRCRVDVFLMRVTKVREHWLEDHRRRRRWMRIRDAAACVREELHEFFDELEAAVGLESSIMATQGGTPPTASESAYIVPGETSPDAIAKSLQALLPTRRHTIVRQRFTVLDTVDGRIRRAGARLTSSGANGTATLTWRPRGGDGQLEARLEQAVHFAWDLPESRLQQALATTIGVRRLIPQADAEEQGSLLDVLDDRGKTIARVRIQSGQARLPARRAWQSLPTVVTLTGLRGYRGAYERLVPIIESRPGVKPCPEGLEGMILRQVGAPAFGAGSSPRVEIAPTIRADAGARQIHLALLSILVANEPGLRANLDTEFLHDFRVAVRRTRSLLGQIKEIFPPDVVEHFSTEFSWLGRLTGPPRDMDVLVLTLRQQQPRVPAADLVSLMAFLERTQQQQREGLIEALDSHRYQRLMSDWKAFLARRVPLKPRAANAGHPLRDVIARRAWRLSRRIAGSAETIDEHTEVERIHEIRVDAKKLRYLVDVAPAFYGAADLEQILGALKKLQRVLGDFNDAAVHETRLVELARGLDAADGPADVLVALGRLAEQSLARRNELRAHVIKHLVEFRADGIQSACRRAFKLRKSQEIAR